MNTKNTNTAFRLPVTLKSDLADICQIKGMYMTAAVKQLLEDYIRQELANPETASRLEQLRHRKASEASHRSATAWHIEKV